MSPVLVVAAPLALLVLDAIARRLGVYASTTGSWPAGFREASLPLHDTSPYREHHGRQLVAVVNAGIPRLTSIFLLPVLGVALAWSLAVPLAVADLRAAFQGRRALALVLASLVLCAVRASSGVATLMGALGRSPRLLVCAGSLALGLDVALALYPLPCSDVRAHDVAIATFGAAAQAALMVGFAISSWMRRGLVMLEEHDLPDSSPLDDDLE